MREEIQRGRVNRGWRVGGFAWGVTTRTRGETFKFLPAIMAGFLAGIMTSPRHGKSPLRLYTFAGYNAQILSRDTIVDSIKRNFEFHHRGISLATGWCLDRCKTRSLDKTVRFYNVQAGIDRFVVGFRAYSLPYSILPRIVYLIYELVIGRSVIKYRASYSGYFTNVGKFSRDDFFRIS